MVTKTNWTDCKLGDAVNLKRGYDLPERDRVDGEYLVVSSSGVTGSHNVAMVRGPGVVTGRYGTLGQVFYVPSDFWPLNTSLYVQDFRGNHPLFVFYLLQTLNFGQQSGAAAVPGVNRNVLHMLRIRRPDLSTQRKIAAILSAYDDLIDNNLRRIKILEEMAQNLYREWFVKLRFPGHQSARFTDSPLGQIPEGWEVSEFRNLFEIKYGKTLPKTKIADVGPYPVYGAGDIIGYHDEVLYREKCTLVTSRGNGSGTVWRTREAAFVTNNSLIILPRIEFKHWDYSFVELLLKHSNVMEAKTGSAQPQVTIENLNYVKAIVPEKPCVERFCSFATPISEQVDLYLSKNATLRSTRDLLLPKLISGEVDVSELDIAVPEANS
jgi:type I restriction enzyme S subunit